jgi:hypothetical protein
VPIMMRASEPPINRRRSHPTILAIYRSYRF